MKLLLGRAKLLVEPTGALATAAVLTEEFVEVRETCCQKNNAWKLAKSLINSSEWQQSFLKSVKSTIGIIIYQMLASQYALRFAQSYLYLKEFGVICLLLIIIIYNKRTALKLLTENSYYLHPLERNHSHTFLKPGVTYLFLYLHSRPVTN